MAKVRGQLLGGLLGMLLLWAAPAQAAVADAASTPAAVQVAGVQVAGVTVPQGLSPALRQTQPGPVLDPTQTDKANAEKSRNKLIAGAIAVVLLVIVFFGRRARSKRNKGD
ncbi:MAG TPA: hypothetical protein VG674_29375 [Amycolatopsis sp.]|nr:hypothetical protein [Amycolatopsis sp.]